MTERPDPHPGPRVYAAVLALRQAGVPVWRDGAAHHVHGFGRVETDRELVAIARAVDLGRALQAEEVRP